MHYLTSLVIFKHRAQCLQNYLPLHKVHTVASRHSIYLRPGSYSPSIMVPPLSMYIRR